ncbi:MAG TPA: MarP family serine protease, partial [Streptosporangiaceae bacterium]
GTALGIFLAPSIAMLVTKRQDLQAVLAIIIVFAAAVVGMLITSAIGVALRARVRRPPSTVLDSLGGAVVNVVAILLLAWLIASLVAYAPPFPGIAYQVNNSVLLKTVDRLIPQDARPEFSALRRLLSTQPYVQVFGALGAETALNVPKPDEAVLHSPGLIRDANSIVKVEGLAPSCSRRIEGSGFVIGADRVVTNAHVVAGITDGPQVFTRSGTPFPARVVLFDPKRDVAVLYVPGLNLPRLQVVRSAPFGAKAIVAGYPLDHPFTGVAARVGRAELANGPDIYDRSRVIRDIYPIRAVVLPGNSGGPLIGTKGQVYGMVFAAAVSVRDTGYALTGTEIAGDIRAGLTRTTGTSTGQCQ